MIQNFEYFVWGNTTEHRSLYGLYNAVVDCFILVTPSLGSANKLKTILSSRYELILIELSSADNFTPNLIDNTVCTNWSFEGKNQIKIGMLCNYFDDEVTQADILCVSSRPLQWQLESEQEYALMCQHWINFIKQQKQYTDTEKFDKFLSLPGLEDDLLKVTSEIYRTMYLGQNLQQVDQHIKTLIGDKLLNFVQEI